MKKVMLVMVILSVIVGSGIWLWCSGKAKDTESNPISQQNQQRAGQGPVSAEEPESKPKPVSQPQQHKGHDHSGHNH